MSDRRLLACLGRGGVMLLWLWCSAAIVEAAGPLPEIVSAKIGLGGHYKTGHWTPIEVVIRGGTAPTLAKVSIILPDDNNLATHYSTPSQRPVQIVPDQTARAVIYGKLGSQVSQLDVTLRLDSGKIIERQLNTYDNSLFDPIPTVAGGKVYLSLGPAVGIATDQDRPGEVNVVRIDDLAELPTQWYGYSGVDAVVIATSRPEVFQRLQTNSAQLAALEQWVELGGHLVLCAGAAARQVLDPTAPLARFAPGKLVDVETIASGAQLEAYCGAKEQIPPVGRGESIQLQVPRFDRIAGVVEVLEGSTPMVVRSPRGFGRITFVACDLDTRPLSNWKGRESLVNKLLTGRTTTDSDSSTSEQQSYNAFNDLTTQLASALDKFPGVRVVPFWVVAMLILGYIALVGPGDYLLVKHVLRRMELTWVTFPLIVVLTSAGAYVAAYWLKGTQLKLNQVDVVDLDVQSGAVRGSSWINLFSPNTATYSLSLKPRELPNSADSQNSVDSQISADATSVLFSWLGRAGNNWRGMNNPSGVDLFKRSYSVPPTLDRLEGVPIEVWTPKTFAAVWYGHRQAVPATSLKVGVDDSLAGTVTNHWDIPLEDCVVAFDRWAYRLGNLPAGGQSQLDASARREDVQFLLKEYEQVQTNKFSSVVSQARPYDASSENVAMIVRTMMFHAACGDKQYTRLDHDQSRWLDLSEHLKLGRAVLLGRAATGHVAAQLERDGVPLTGHDDQRWTYYRIVLPVDLGDRAQPGTVRGKKL